jgi:hypothetical protein
MTEPLQFNVVSSPDDYKYDAEGPIRYVTVINEHGPLGYLWFSDDEGAADFQPSRAGGTTGVNAAVAWTPCLREAKAKGMLPSEAVTSFASYGKDSQRGWVAPNTEAQVSSLRALKDLAERQ